MTDAPSWFRGHLQELSREECLDLLASKSVGRVAYCAPEGPEVLPLNYVLLGDSLLFRTAPHSALGQRLRLDVAAFQVDEIDDYTESGWSVLLRGMVTPVEYDDLPPAEQRPQPWAAGSRPLHLRLAPRTITGRRLLPG
jgi:uncharacterized protein